MLELLLFALVGATLLVLHFEFGPILIHRPIFVGPIIGSLVGTPSLGFFLGSVGEWACIDRIPAGGLRTPAFSLGVVAAILAVSHMGWDLSTTNLLSGGYYVSALLVMYFYTVIYVPLDGGLRRLWSIPSENAILALERGSSIELQVFNIIAFLTKFTLIWLLLLSSPWLLKSVVGTFKALQLFERMHALPWGWVLVATGLALLLRLPKKPGQMGYVALFFLGVFLSWVL